VVWLAVDHFKVFPNVTFVKDAAKVIESWAIMKSTGRDDNATATIDQAELCRELREKKRSKVIRLPSQFEIIRGILNCGPHRPKNRSIQTHTIYAFVCLFQSVGEVFHKASQARDGRLVA